MLHLYTDGSQIGSLGGWAYILSDGCSIRYDYDCVSNADNNAMELQAVIEGLESIVEPSNVTVYTDSRFVIINTQHEVFTYHRVKFVKIKSRDNVAHHLAREGIYDEVLIRNQQLRRRSSIHQFYTG